MDSADISVVDVTSLEEVSRIIVDKGPQGIFLISDSKYLWFAL